MATRSATRAVETAGEDFTFEHEGETYSLPNAATTKAGILRKAVREGRDEAEQIFIILEEIADEGALAALDDMTVVKMQETFLDWQKHGGVKVGE